MDRGRFASFRSHNYRLFFGAYLISETGDWVQRIGQILLLLSLGGSPLELGILAALQQLPVLLLGAWAGLVADRFNRRLIIVLTLGSGAVLALLLGLLATFDRVTIPILFLFALLLGIGKAVGHPAKQGLIFDMVDAARLTNALTLSSVTFNVARSVGPAIAGVLIGAYGVPVSFYVNVASGLAAVLALRMIRAELLHTQVAAVREPRQLQAGLSYVRSTPGLLGPLLLMTVAGLLAYEWTVTVPLLATQGFGREAEVVGAMFSAMGLGAVVGGLLLAGVLHGSDKVLLVCGSGFSVMVLALGLSPSLTVAFAVLFLIGGASTVFRATATSLLQQRSRPDMRGRVMGLLSVALMGTSPLGGPLAGFMAESIGIRATLVVAGSVTGVATVAAFAYSRRDHRGFADG